MFDLPFEEGDAEGYIERVSHVLDGILVTVRPAQLFLVKIDQWFGERWLDFSFKCMGAFGVWQHRDPTLPPFHPHRVRWQRHYVAASTGAPYEFDGEGFPLHVRQSSESNQHRHVASIPFRDAVLLWTTGDTARVGRGSLMAYYSHPSVPGRAFTSTWYTSFDAAPSWHADRLRNIGVRELDALVERGRAARAAAPHITREGA